MDEHQKFNVAYDSTPLQIQKWIEEHQHKNKDRFYVDLFYTFVFPLQLEVSNLRYNPEKAVPFELPVINSGDIPY